MQSVSLISIEAPSLTDEKTKKQHTILNKSFFVFVVFSFQQQQSIYRQEACKIEEERSKHQKESFNNSERGLKAFSTCFILLSVKLINILFL